MAKTLRPEDREFRRVVEELDGDQHAVAAFYGCTQSTVSAKCNTQRNRAWWAKLKRERARRRKREREARWRAGVARRERVQ